MNTADSRLSDSHDLTWRQCYQWAAVYQTALVLITLLTIYFVNDGFDLEALRVRFSAWDGANYISIVNHGYAPYDERQASMIVFFPLFPFLIYILTTIMPDWIAGVCVTTLCSFFGHAIFLKYLGESGLPRARIVRTSLLFAVTPVAVYFTHIYTEALFLLESSALLFFLRRQHIIGACIVGFLAALTRMPGTLFVLPIAIEICFQRKTIWEKLKSLAWCGVPPLGFLTYLYINYHVHGNFFYYTKPMKDVWNKQPTNPFAQYYENLLKAFDGYSPYITDYYGLVVDWLATFLLVPFLIFFIVKKLFSRDFAPHVTAALILWSVAQALLVMSQSTWTSNIRYLGLILPLYSMIESSTYQSKHFAWAYYLVFTTFVALAGAAVVLFSLQKWVA